MAAQLVVHPVGNYTFGSKPPKHEKDTSTQAKLERLKEKYAREGLRRTVDGILVVHEHGHPHVLVLQMGSAFFRLPGGRLRPGEDEAEGMLRKLSNLLAPAAENMRPDWRIADVLGTWYRPNFENLMYPYCPPHISRPKEVRRLFLIALPERCYLSVPKNMRLVAVPLFEIYDNISRYGPVISSIPALLSRFSLTLAGRAPPAAAAAAAAAQAAAAAMVAAHQQQQAQHAQQAQQQQQQLVQYGQQPGQPGQQLRGGISVSLAGQPAVASQPAQPPPPQQQPAQYGYQQADEGLMVDFDDM